MIIKTTKTDKHVEGYLTFE